MCLSRLLFDIECWGCGMTRAVMHFHHFEFSDAIYYNMGVVLVYPLLIIVWYIWVKAALKETGLLKQPTEK
jgi:Ni/Fe-hydrogenase subunit HybB-like protein